MTTNSIAYNRTLFLEDNLPVLRGLDSKSIDLIATDPPFNKGVKDFSGKTKAGVKVSYKDVWNWDDDVHDDWIKQIGGEHPKLYNSILHANEAAGDDMGAYLCFMAVRVLEMHRVLKDTGSIYLHCDPTASHYLKAMMDAIFGRKQFRNELVWDYRKVSNAAAKKFNRAHDIILFYAKSKSSTFNRQYESELSDRKQELVRVGYNTKNMGGERYLYIYDEDTVKEKERLGKINRQDFDHVRYVDVTKGNVLTDVFKVDHLNSQSKENVGYPTQKPLALYKRMIEASSNPGDMVLDPFAGCATTSVAAEQLDRQWIGIDINEEAEEVIRERLDREVDASMAWNDILKVLDTAPERTDDGKFAAPELLLESPGPQEPKLSTAEAKARLLKMDDMVCLGCGWEPPYADYLQVDHKKPKDKKGREVITNFGLLCGPCNLKKGKKWSLRELQEQRIAEGRMNMKWYEEDGKWK